MLEEGQALTSDSCEYAAHPDRNFAAYAARDTGYVADDASCIGRQGGKHGPH